jgi:hypothetical protein
VPIFFRPAALDCLQKAAEAVFGKPISDRVLRRIIIAAPAVPLIYKGPLLALFLLWGLTTWLVPIMYRHLLGWRLQHHEAVSRAAAAEASLSQAAAQRLDLERDLQKVRDALQEADDKIQKVTKALRKAEGDLRKERNCKKPDPSTGSPKTVFRRVGLDPSAPQFAIEAVRRAYRRNLHPDLQPVERKAEAERRFKESEQVFDEIWRLRGL